MLFSAGMGSHHRRSHRPRYRSHLLRMSVQNVLETAKGQELQEGFEGSRRHEERSNVGQHAEGQGIIACLKLLFAKNIQNNCKPAKLLTSKNFNSISKVH